MVMTDYNICSPPDEKWIPAEEVHFHQHSFADPGGRLFLWKGKLYRAITDQQAPFIKSLFHSGVIEKLVLSGMLPETELTDYRLSGYELIVRHRAIPLPSYPNEWCPAMLKDAALMTVELCRELAEFHLTLKDAHPWNVLYEGGRPIWVDLNSIVPIKTAGQWEAYEEFRHFCLNPLLLMQHGDEQVARAMMSEDVGVSDALVQRLTRKNLLPGKVRTTAGLIGHRLSKAVRLVTQSLFGGNIFDSTSKQPSEPDWKSQGRLLQKIKRQIENISIRSSTFDESVGRAGHFSCAQVVIAVSRLVKELRPASLLDIGGKAPWLAVTAKTLDAEVVSFNSDSRLATSHYLENPAYHLPLMPLVMDFSKPTPARGLNEHWAVAASDRLQCEMVLALGPVLEEARSKSHLNFEQIVEGLSAFSKRWIVVEVNRQTDPNIFAQLIRALYSKFRIVRVVPVDDYSPLSETLLLAEK